LTARDAFATTPGDIPPPQKDEWYAAVFLPEDDVEDMDIEDSAQAIDYSLERKTGRPQADRWTLEYGWRETADGERAWGFTLAGYATK